MARALFGDQVEMALETLNRQFHMVRIAADSNSRAVNDREFQRSIRADLSSASNGDLPNKMNDLIAAQVKIIESICVPVLRLEEAAP